MMFGVTHSCGERPRANRRRPREKFPRRAASRCERKRPNTRAGKPIRGAAPLLSTAARDQFVAVANGGNFTEVKPPYFVTDGQKEIAACFDRESSVMADHDPSETPSP